MSLHADVLASILRHLSAASLGTLSACCRTLRAAVEVAFAYRRALHLNRYGGRVSWVSRTVTTVHAGLWTDLIANRSV